MLKAFHVCVTSSASAASGSGSGSGSGWLLQGGPHPDLQQQLQPPRVQRFSPSFLPELSNSTFWQAALLQGQLNTAPLSTIPSEDALARGAPIRTSELRRQTVGSEHLSFSSRFLSETALPGDYGHLGGPSLLPEHLPSRLSSEANVDLWGHQVVLAPSTTVGGQLRGPGANTDVFVPQWNGIKHGPKTGGLAGSERPGSGPARKHVGDSEQQTGKSLTAF